MQVDIKWLVRGDKTAWEAFVERFSPVIYSAVRRTLHAPEHNDDDILDVAQDVFVRLCKNEYRLLKTYDSARASLITWLTLIARSVAIDFLRRRRPELVPLDEMPTDIIAAQAPSPDPLIIPPDLLSPRQKLVMHLLYDRQMEVGAVAEVLGVDVQTVRSTRHKALLKLRKHFGSEAKFYW